MYIYIYIINLTSKNNKQNLQPWFELYYDQILFTKLYEYLSIKFFSFSLISRINIYLYLWFSFKSCSITTTRISLRIQIKKKKKHSKQHITSYLVNVSCTYIRVWIVINFPMWTMNFDVQTLGSVCILWNDI